MLQSLLPPLLPPYEQERLELVALYLGRIILTTLLRVVGGWMNDVGID